MGFFSLLLSSLFPTASTSSAVVEHVSGFDVYRKQLLVADIPSVSSLECVLPCHPKAPISSLFLICQIYFQKTLQSSFFYKGILTSENDGKTSSQEGSNSWNFLQTSGKFGCLKFVTCTHQHCNVPRESLRKMHVTAYRLGAAERVPYIFGAQTALLLMSALVLITKPIRYTITC